MKQRHKELKNVRDEVAEIQRIINDTDFLNQKLDHQVNFLSINLTSVIEKFNEQKKAISGVSTEMSKATEKSNEYINSIAATSEANNERWKKGLFDLINTLPLELGNVWVASEDIICGGLDELFGKTEEGLKKKRDWLIQAYATIEKDVAIEIEKVKNEQNAELVKQNAQRAAIEEKKEKERRQEQLKGEIFHHENFIKQRESQVGEIWKYLEDGQDIYRKYFKAKRELYKDENDKLRETLTEENEYRLEVEKFYQERKRAAIEEKFKEDKVALKNQLAEGLVTREEYAQQEEQLTISYLENEIALRNSYGKDTIGLEEQLADTKLTIREREEAEAKRIIAATKQNEETEKESLKTRADQWTEYAEKVSAISQQVSEITGMVTNSLGGMFNQLSASYTQEIESLNEKIAAVDEEKEAALERVALTEDERNAREEELAQQKISLEYATSKEQKNKADERIATLQGELGAEDSINRDFESKKASLEKEKEKKEKAQKKAEKMQKRLEMSQAIVEAIGNIAQGAAKALSFGPILGPILAAVVSAAGAIQVGIMTKQLAKMEDGGLLRGKRHSQGGMHIQGSNIEVEGGEYVINRRTTQKNLGLMNHINSQHKELTPTDINSYFNHPFSVPTFSSPFSGMMKQGGQVPMLPLSTSADAQQIMQAIGDINFQPRVAITDIHHTEQQMTKVDEWTGM